MLDILWASGDLNILDYKASKDCQDLLSAAMAETVGGEV